MTTTLTAPATHYPGWNPGPDSIDLLTELEDLPWEAKTMWMYGRQVKVPRLTCWIGTEAYTYSGITNQPHPWTPELAAIRAQLSYELGVEFNSCLANRYRDGQDSVGWHRDNEPGLGDRPTIATLSLGATRQFSMRLKTAPPVAGRDSLTTFDVAHGDLLVMHDDAQTAWEHSVQKDPTVTGERISLTFRRFHPKES